MRVAFLGPTKMPTLAYLREVGDDVIQTMEPLDTAFVEGVAPDFGVSHGYRHIVRPEVLGLLPRRVLNLHISLLPWNRGADPNLWSWVDDTPKGVTIHLMDEGVDTGDVVAQRGVEMDADETLRSSYAKLQAAVVELFRETWPAFRAGRVEPSPQVGEGSTHRVADKARVEHLLVGGWDTPVRILR